VDLLAQVETDDFFAHLEEAKEKPSNRATTREALDDVVPFKDSSDSDDNIPEIPTIRATMSLPTQEELAKEVQEEISLPNNILPISNEAVRYDPAIIDDPLKDTTSVKP
jgi:hypothetical protein